MVKTEKSVTINAPVEKVFAYMTDPTNLPEIWPSMVEVKDVKRSPDGSHSFGWVYKMACMRFEGTSATTEIVTNQRVVAETKGGIPSKFVWTYQAEDGGTKLTMAVEYTVPVPLLGKLAEALIVRQNEHEAEVMLANLKDRMET